MPKQLQYETECERVAKIGCYALHYARYGGKYIHEAETMKEAAGMAEHINDSGEGYPIKITRKDIELRDFNVDCTGGRSVL